MNYNNVYAVLDILSATPSRNDKICILEDAKNVRSLIDVFTHTLDPYIQYHIKKIPKYTPSQNGVGLQVFLDALPEFYERRVTGNAAIQRLHGLLSSLSKDDSIVAERIIGKSLKCGVGASTINKVHPKLIPKYPCLLGRPYSEKNMANIYYPAYSQIKADGMRVNIIYRVNPGGTDYITIRGRSGKLIDLLGYLDDAFLELGRYVVHDVVFDGELVMHDQEGYTLSRKIGNGILNKGIKGTISKEEAEMVRVRLWDLIDYDEFVKGVGTVVYRDRIDDITDAVKSVPSKLYRVIETKIVDNKAQALDHFHWATVLGEEGTMLKNVIGRWKDTRSKDLVKLKAENDCDLVVVDWKEGTGKYIGQLGALICESSCGGLRVSVGSGFTDEERATITNNIIGTIIAVKYNEQITSDTTNIVSLFLPRFIEIRRDKTIADSLSEIA